MLLQRRSIKITSWICLCSNLKKMWLYTSYMVHFHWNLFSWISLVLFFFCIFFHSLFISCWIQNSNEIPETNDAYGWFYAVHSIDNELEDSSQIKPVVRTSLALCSTVYIATSFFGYLLFGESTLHDVLANFDINLGIPYSAVFSDVVRVSYAVHLMLVFPMIFHALRLNLDGLLFPNARPLSTDNCRFTVISVALLSLIFFAANFIPSIWDAFQFTGATAAVCIGFIFPAAMTIRWVIIAYNFHFLFARILQC